MAKKYTAAMIVIGNEILSGRTQDKNINYVACKLVESGVSLAEVRIVPDVADVIIDAVNELRERVDYVFTSGGIGPTHDDITAQCVADAFELELKEDPVARSVLLDHYGENDLTEARLRMARVPEGAVLIPNPVSAAPGFQIGNVYVMAGVPRIMQAMMDHVCSLLKGGDVVLSRSIPSKHTESVIAAKLGEVQDCYPDVEIGSYPFFKDGVLGVNIVLRSTKAELLDVAEKAICAFLDAL